MAGAVREVPEVVRDWLERNRIPLDPADRGQAVWAEWDGRRGELLLGVWAQIVCPRCGQTDRPERSLVVPAGFDDNDWQHGCGYWWAPTVALVPDPPEPGEGLLVELLDAGLRNMRRRQREAVDEVRGGLAGELRRFLERYPDEDDRVEQASGSELEPGIWRPDGGQWEAWAYDPAGGGDTVTVVESDLADM